MLLHWRVDLRLILKSPIAVARPEDMMPFGVPIPAFLKKQLLEQAASVADLEEQGMQEEVKVLTKKLKLRMTDNPTGKSASASWVEEPGRQVNIIKQHGRLADIICVAKPDVSRNLGTNTLKAALFHTGRPVMMCPPANELSDGFGDTIAIAWNGSKEAARAVALTLSLTTSAKQLVILSGGTEVHGSTTDDLVEYFQMRGVAATVQRFKAGKDVGEDLLRNAKDVGADVLIMGAYGDSYEAETVFGGTTQSVVDASSMPIVLVH